MRLNRSADYIVLGDQFLIAEITDREGRSIVADLYRNPEDFVSDRAMERQVSLRLRNPRPYHRGCSSYARQRLSADAS
jgi:hypothetical protein